MAAMTSTFLGSAVAVKAPVVAAKKAAVAPVASLDGLKKVRALHCDHEKTYLAKLDSGDARPAFDDEALARRSVPCGPSRTRPRSTRTTRRRRVARPSPRRTSAAPRSNARQRPDKTTIAKR